MSSITIKKVGITKLDTEVIVNAANERLLEGDGVCGAIFREAGSEEMSRACNAVGGCKTGEAVITPGFKLLAKHVIHAVGPRWLGGSQGEPELLYSAYKNSLFLAQEHNLHSIGFPLISAGIFQYPSDKAWKQAIKACLDYIRDYPSYDIDIVFAVLDDAILEEGNRIIQLLSEKEED